MRQNDDYYGMEKYILRTLKLKSGEVVDPECSGAYKVDKCFEDLCKSESPLFKWFRDINPNLNKKDKKDKLEGPVRFYSQVCRQGNPSKNIYSIQLIIGLILQLLIYIKSMIDKFKFNPTQLSTFKCKYRNLLHKKFPLEETRTCEQNVNFVIV